MDASVVTDENAAVRGEPRPGEMAGLFRLEAVEVDMFRARGVPGEPGRLFGGQVAAQALAAAAATVTGARPHSLHAYFLRPGDASRPVLFQVDRLHDGRAFRRRRVSAIQSGEPILSLECSFTADTSDATDYQPAPPVSGPDDCSDYVPRARFGGRLSPWHLLSGRVVPGMEEVPFPLATTADLWLRVDEQVAAAVAPAVLLTYLSDLTLGATTIRPTRQYPAGRQEVTGLTSLDHSIWFHHPADVRDWLFYEKSAVAVGPGRGLVTGRIFNRDGTLAASVAQEALLHFRRGPGPKEA